MPLRHLLLTTILLVVNALSAQDANIMRVYNRPTIANLILLAEDQNNFESKLIESFGTISDNPKYNLSNISFGGIDLKGVRAANYNDTSKGRDKSITSKLRRFVEDKAEFFPPVDTFGNELAAFLSKTANVGGLMMGEWATKTNGTYPVILKRTQQSLSSEDLRNRTDASKLDVYEGVLRSNYIIVYDFIELETGETPTTAGGKVGFTGNLAKAAKEGVSAVFHAYIYYVDIDDNLFGNYVAPNFDETSKIKSYNYPIKYLGHVAVKETFQPSEEYSTMQMVGNIRKKGLMKGLINTYKATEDGIKDPSHVNPDTQGHEVNIPWNNLPQIEKDTFIFNNLARMGFEDVMSVAEMQIEAFKVRTVINGTYPITAPVGVREGVRADQRYRVYENVLRGDSIVTQSVGLVRASNKIAANQANRFDENGAELFTVFKQTAGKPIKEDMFMVQENDFGLSLSFGFQSVYNAFKQLPNTVWHVRSSFNISRAANRILGKNNIYGLYSYVGLGLGSSKQEGQDWRMNSFSLNFGIAKRLYQHRKFDIIPELGLSIVSFGVSSSEFVEFSEEGWLFMNLGCRFAAHITESFSIEPAFEIPLKLSSNTSENPASFLHLALRGRYDF